jgi:hypothetical protein
MLKKLTALVLVTSVFLAACAEQGIPVAYACDGTTDEIEVTYHTSAEATTTERVTLPWEADFMLTADEADLRLLALNPVETGEVSCSVAVDGRTVTDAEAPGGVEITVAYQKSGNTSRISSERRGFSAESGPALIEQGEELLDENAGDPEGSIAFENATAGVDVCEIYLAPDVDTADWGENRISTPLSPGEVRTIDDLAYDQYKVRAVDCEGVIVAVSREFRVDSALEAVNIDNPTNTRPSTIVNQSSEAICEVAISPDGQNFSPDLLSDGQRLDEGDEVSVLLTEGGWALRVETCEGTTALLENLTLRTGLGYGWTVTDETLEAGGLDIQAEAADIVIRNTVDENICVIRYAAQNSPDWSGNLLNAPIGRDDQTTLFNVPRGVIDLKAETCSDEVVDWVYGFDISDQTADYQLTLDGGPNVDLINQTGTTLCALNVRPSGTGAWQRDLLNPSQQVSPGANIILHLPTDRAYDLRGVSCDVEEFVVNSVNASGGITLELTP